MTGNPFCHGTVGHTGGAVATYSHQSRGGRKQLTLQYHRVSSLKPGTSHRSRESQSHISATSARIRYHKKTLCENARIDATVPAPPPITFASKSYRLHDRDLPHQDIGAQCDFRHGPGVSLSHPAYPNRSLDQYFPGWHRWKGATWLFCQPLGTTSPPAPNGVETAPRGDRSMRTALSAHL